MTDTHSTATAAPQGRVSNTASPTLSSWAVPTALDDEIWQAMTRDQQLAALQAHFASQDCTTPTTHTVAEIVARARAGHSPS
jgi:hypothetical protein